MTLSVYPPIQPEGFQKTAFGELITLENEPVIQLDFTHIVPVDSVSIGTMGATSARNATQGIMEVSTGVTPGAAAVFRSSRALVYRAGQGNMARWSAKFTAGSVGSNQLTGPFSTSDGFAFGYMDDQFGILYRRNGDSEIQTLTVTVAAGGAENATVTINGTPYTVPLTGVGTVQGDAREISESLSSQVPLGAFIQVDDTVVYTSRLSQAESGFAYTSATSVAAWVQDAPGNAPEEDFIPQSDWNTDTKPSLNPENFNVYEIQYQFLGAGNIEFYVENSDTGDFDLVHIIKYANSSTTPSLRNPNIYLTIFAENTTGTIDKTVATISMAAFRQGPDIKTQRANSDGGSATVGTTLTNIATYRIRDEVGGRAFRGEATFGAVALSTDSTKGAIFQFIVGADVAGGTNFQYFDQDDSMMIVDQSNGAVTGGRLVSTARLGRESGETFLLGESNEVLIAGQTLTVAAAVTSGAASDCGVALTWFEGI